MSTVVDFCFNGRGPFVSKLHPSIHPTCPLCALSKLSLSVKDKIVIEESTGKCSLEEVSKDGGKSCMANLKESIIEELKEFLPALLKKEMQDIPKKFNETEESKSKPAVKHSLMLTPNGSDVENYTPEVWSEVVKKLPSQLGNLPVENSRLTFKGMGELNFPNQKVRDQAAESLKKDYVVKVQ